jgi:hypothetical protein
MFKLISIVLITAFLAGCGITSVPFYDGAKRTNKEVALFSMWVDGPKFRGEFYPAELKINSEEINGEKFQTNEQIEVLPGTYQFKVKCDYKGKVQYKTYNIEAEAGKNYAVVTSVDNEECIFDKLKYVINNERFEEMN